MNTRQSTGWRFFGGFGLRGSGPRFSHTLALVLVGFGLLWPGASRADVTFVANAQVSAQAQRFFGRITLTLQGDEEISHAQVFVYGLSGTQSFLTAPTWNPKQQQNFSFDLPASHPLPGWYHLLLEIRFQDQAEVWFSSSMGIEYRFGNAVRSQAMPTVTFQGNRLTWPNPPVKRASLTVTTGPHWKLGRASLTPADSHLKLHLRSPQESPLLGWPYTQTARLDWVEKGTHQSRLLPWILQTDASGHNWYAENQTDGGTLGHTSKTSPWWSSTAFIVFAAFFLVALAINRRILLETFRKTGSRSKL